MTKYLLLDPRFIAYRPVMELPTHAELGAGPFARAIYRMVTFAKARIKRRLSINALNALDDRLLRDIGIDRYTIEATVDAILKGDLAVAPRASATVHRLVSAETTPAEVALRSAA